MSSSSSENLPAEPARAVAATARSTAPRTSARVTEPAAKKVVAKKAAVKAAGIKEDGIPAKKAAAKKAGLRLVRGKPLQAGALECLFKLFRCGFPELVAYGQCIQRTVLSGHLLDGVLRGKSRAQENRQGKG